MLVPHHRNPYLGYWLPLAITKKTPPFPGFLRKSPRDYTAKKYPLSRENGNTHTFEWGWGRAGPEYFLQCKPSSFARIIT